MIVRELLLVWGLAAVVFTLVWALSVRLHNYGFVDLAWSFGVALSAPLVGWNAPAMSATATIFIGIGVIWSLRLGTHILLRVWREHPTEDSRYATLRARWPSAARFLVFFQAQAALVPLFVLPFVLVAYAPAQGWSEVRSAGLALAIISLVGETVADAQLAAFKRRPASRGRVCSEGLWAWSRHPNYFFEFTFWCGCALVALPSPWGWLALACPAAMLYFLMRVTGIPITEAHAVARKGDAYREYQRTTSAFVPLPPRSSRRG